MKSSKSDSFKHVDMVNFGRKGDRLRTRLCCLQHIVFAIKPSNDQ
jgi:hypothetical protein